MSVKALRIGRGWSVISVAVQGPYVWIALGAAIGGMARYGLSGVVGNWIGATFPWGTLVVNVTGCFIIGIINTLTGPDGKLLVLLCHFIIHQRPLLPQTARTPGQRGDQPDGELTVDGSNRTRHMPLRPHRRPRAAGSLRVAQVFRSACG
jgi:CrcB-like protein, Camphor Resistance (CrcB)